MANGNEGLVATLVIDQSQADKQVDAFVDRARKKLEKLTVSPKFTGAGGGPGGGNSSRASVDREIDYNLRQKTKALEAAERESERSRVRETQSHNREQAKMIAAYEKAAQSRISAERRAAEEVIRINADSLRRLDRMRETDNDKITRLQRSARSNVQGALVGGTSEREALNAQRRVDAALVAQTRSRLAEIIRLEEAAGRKIQQFRIKQTSGGQEIAVPTDPYGMGTRAGSKRNSRGISQLFQVQQAVEDFQYAGFRGLSNNLAFLSANLKSARLAGIGLFAVMTVGALEAVGAFDSMKDAVSGTSDAVEKFHQRAIAAFEGIEKARASFEQRKPRSGQEFDERETSALNEVRGLGVKSDVTSKMEEALRAARKLESHFSVFGNKLKPAEVNKQFEVLRGVYGDNPPIGGSGQGLKNIIDDLQKRTVERRGEEAGVRAELAEQLRLLREQSPEARRLGEEAKARAQILRPSERATLAAEDSPADRAIRDARQKLRRLDAEWEELLHEADHGLGKEEFGNRQGGIMRKADAAAKELENANFLKEVEKAKKELQREQLDAEKDKVREMKTEISHNKSLIAQEEAKIEHLSKESRLRKDSRDAFEGRAFDTSRGLVQRGTDRELQTAKFLDRQNNPFLPPEIQQVRDQVHDQIFQQIALERDRFMQNSKISSLGQQAETAGGAGDFERQRKLLEQRQALQFEAANSDPSLGRSFQMLHDAEKTQKLIEKSFAKEAEAKLAEIARIEKANEALRTKMGSLEGAIVNLERAIRGLPEKAREQAKKELGGKGAAGVGAGDLAAEAEVPAAGKANDRAFAPAPQPKQQPPELSPLRKKREASDQRVAEAEQRRKQMDLGKRIIDPDGAAAEKAAAAETERQKSRAAAKRHNDRLQNVRDRASDHADNDLADKWLKDRSLPATASDRKRNTEEGWKKTIAADKDRMAKAQAARDQVAATRAKKEDTHQDRLANVRNRTGDHNDNDLAEAWQKNRELPPGERERRARIDGVKQRQNPDGEAIKRNTAKAAAETEKAERDLQRIQDKIGDLARSLREEARRPNNTTIINNNFGGGGGGGGLPSLPPMPGIPGLPGSPSEQTIPEVTGRAGRTYGFSAGGRVPGTGFGDTVAAALSPHEVVLTTAQQRRIASYAGDSPEALFGAAGVPGFPASPRRRILSGFSPYNSAVHLIENGGAAPSSSTTNSSTVHNRTSIGGVSINVKSVEEAGRMMARMRTEERAARMRRGSN